MRYSKYVKMRVCIPAHVCYIAPRSGWGSQWYSSPFKALVMLDSGSDEGAVPKEALFLTAEHWMMFQKAVLFSDTAIAGQILEARGTGKSDMAHIKALGRKVQGFDNATWVANRESIVLEGSLLKFEQNKVLRDKLLDTGDKIIVEASPRDRIWGVGFGEKNAPNQKHRWGLNLLGKALQETRRIIREEQSA